MKYLRHLGDLILILCETILNALVCEIFQRFISGMSNGLEKTPENSWVAERKQLFRVVKLKVDRT